MNILINIIATESSFYLCVLSSVHTNSETEYENASFLKQASLKLNTTIQPISNHSLLCIPPENIRKCRFSDVFRGYISGRLVENNYRERLNFKIIDVGSRLLELKYLKHKKK